MNGKKQTFAFFDPFFLCPIKFEESMALIGLLLFYINI